MKYQFSRIKIVAIFNKKILSINKAKTIVKNQWYPKLPSDKASKLFLRVRYTGKIVKDLILQYEKTFSIQVLRRKIPYMGFSKYHSKLPFLPNMFVKLICKFKFYISNVLSHKIYVSETFLTLIQKFQYKMLEIQINMNIFFLKNN